jgi:hypothetical protein
MRIRLRGVAAIVILGVSLSGCAAGMGAVAGNVVGGAAWGAMKGGTLAWKGGALAAKTTGRAVVGAARGVHGEFSGKDGGDADPGATSSGASSADDALGNQPKDVGPVASAQGQGAAFAD